MRVHVNPQSFSIFATSYPILYRYEEEVYNCCCVVGVVAF